jgi:hypothetical protein
MHGKSDEPTDEATVNVFIVLSVVDHKLFI